MLHPIEDGAALAVGDEVEVQLAISTKHSLEYVQLRDPRAVEFEPTTLRSGPKWDLGIRWYEETRDSATNFFFETLPEPSTVPHKFRPSTVRPRCHTSFRSRYCPRYHTSFEASAKGVTPLQVP